MRSIPRNVLLGTGAAGLALILSIGLTNPKEVLAQAVRAALVRDVDNGPRNVAYLGGGAPVATSQGTALFPLNVCSQSFGGFGCSQTVPAGKRLVIEYVSGQARLFGVSPSTLDDFLLRVTPSTGNFYVFPPQKSLMADVYHFNGSGRIYAEPGSTVQMEVFHGPLTQSGFVNISGTGFLVDVN